VEETMSIEETCRERRGVLKKAQCYTYHALTRFSDFSHRQSGEHKVAWALFIIGIIGLTAVGAATLLSTTVNNPTAANVQYAPAWKDGAGNVIPDITTATISGTITCTITVSPAFVVEIATTTDGSMTLATPYYISSMWMDVYKAGTSDKVQQITITVQTANYMAQQAAFANGFSYNPSNPVIPSPPISSSSWFLNFNTFLVPNGAYDLRIRGIWTCCQADKSPMNAMNGYWNPRPPSIASGYNNGWTLLSMTLNIGGGSSQLKAQISANATRGDGSKPLPVAFTSTVTGAQAHVSYLWYFGDGTNSTLSNPVHSFMNGTWDVTLCVKDDLGNSGWSNTIIIRVGQQGEESGLLLFIGIVAVMSTAIVLYLRGRR